eukprot:UN12510
MSKAASAGGKRGKAALFVVRHGERADIAIRGWTDTAERPHDPPLTETGKEQAQKTGHEILRQLLNEDAIGSLAKLEEKEREVIVLTSPFLRCVETAKEIVDVFLGKNISVRAFIEDGLCELISSWYFKEAPELLSRDELFSIFGEHQKLEIIDCESHYKFPDFPERINNMFSRYTNTARGVLKREIARNGSAETSM